MLSVRIIEFGVTVSYRCLKNMCTKVNVATWIVLVVLLVVAVVLVVVLVF